MATSPTLRPASAQTLRRRHPSKIPGFTLFPAAPSGTHEPRGASSPPPEPDRSSKPATKLTGIARLAASSPLAEAKRGAEYFLLPVRSILNRCDSQRVPFAWTVNPYRGCEFGCRYCYARYTHEYMELDGSQFEKKIYVKRDAARLAARALAKERVWGEHIAIGTATDPYQPAEQTFHMTHSILEKMAEREGLSLSITTKSNQIVRDIELLQKIAARSALTINLTLTTLNGRLARLLEPRAPRPDLRLAAVRKLREAELAAGVFVMPILPGITDDEENLDSLASAASSARAQWFAGNVLFLMPSALKQFLPFIEGRFPKLGQRYREWYLRSAYAPESFRHEIAGRIERLRRRYGLGQRPEISSNRAWHSPQLKFEWNLPPAAAYS